MSSFQYNTLYTSLHQLCTHYKYQSKPFNAPHHHNAFVNKKDGDRQRASVSAISLRHILASPGTVHPWDNRGKCHMDEKRIQCLSNTSHHVPIYLQPFPVIQPVSSKVRHFSTFLPLLGKHLDNRGKC